MCVDMCMCMAVVAVCVCVCGVRAFCAVLLSLRLHRCVSACSSEALLADENCVRLRAPLLTENPSCGMYAADFQAWHVGQIMPGFIAAM